MQNKVLSGAAIAAAAVSLALAGAATPTPASAHSMAAKSSNHCKTQKHHCKAKVHCKTQKSHRKAVRPQDQVSRERFARLDPLNAPSGARFSRRLY